MPRLKVLSGAQVRAILEAQGFTHMRTTGSHMIMQKQMEGTTRTASVPNHKEVALGTLKNIIEFSGLPRDLFEA